LLELNRELLEHIESGGTLLVPSRQRATAVRLAHSSAMLGTHLRVWNSPDVLPWSAWVERELDFARARGESLPRRLSAPEEWLLWRDAVHEACAGHDVLMPDALIEPVRRAIGRLDDYGMPLTIAGSAETAVLLQARAGFRRRCAELGVLGTTSWQDCAAYLRPSEQVLLAGFQVLGPTRRQWLLQSGARVAGAASSAAPGSTGDAPLAAARRDAPRVIGCDNPLLEAQAAAQWCAAQLARDAEARLLLVVPRLAQQRHVWQRALAQRLDFRSLLAAGTSSGESPFAIEGGAALDSYPLVATALQLIRLASGSVPFEPLSAVLRSPYLAALDRNQCLRLELWLRENNVGALDAAVLPRLVEPVSARLGAAAAAPLHKLIDAIEASQASGAASPAVWGRAFAQLLSRCGWPGAIPGADEQQVRMRFNELLGDFAAIATPVGRLEAGEASQLLCEMAQRVAFEPASDDVPVTVTASLDDPIVHYDGIWVAGLSAEVWPPAAQPDPLLPLMQQRDAGVPEASAGGQLRLARQSMCGWQQRSVRCVWSWSRSEAELPCDRSPLLDEAPADSVTPSATATAGAPTTGAAAPDIATADVATVAVASMDAPSGTAFDLQSWLLAQSPALEAWRDADGPAWPPGRELQGGIVLLELQSLCPFRSFAELRLQARPLPQPAPGIDPRLRGQMLHLALERFWRATGDSATLHGRSRDATQALVRRSVWSAVEQSAARVPHSIDPALLRREAARAERLIGQLIDWELTRAAFETQSLETPQRLGIAGTSLSLRLDRVDRLADGRLVVIDYKSGAAHKFNAYDERPPKPQLPAYATAAGDQVAAVVALYLGRDSVKPRGLADRPGRVPGRGIDALPGGEAAWPALLQQWRARLERLVREFLDGRAAVQPQPGACEYCHLQMLCRVDAQLLAAAAAAAAEHTPAAQAAQGLQEDGT
jgi:ATP-dependent helicase/nuclease subunit B